MKDGVPVSIPGYPNVSFENRCTYPWELDPFSATEGLGSVQFSRTVETNQLSTFASSHFCCINTIRSIQSDPKQRMFYYVSCCGNTMRDLINFDIHIRHLCSFLTACSNN
ncbi:hypothetical protein DPMN_155515 [Dreissena polymorpha]|uniref:Uncharacterized protein n=1 Tax=Dreissena polymorpha TaxID=45954 RepID=A0A9D4FRC2_DREPO|nr:hypothetical protein DPMN_155515 [Dreissena polymorpha]